MIVYPINALVASQLEPDKFGEHYTVGGEKHYSGKVILPRLTPTTEVGVAKLKNT